MTPRWWDWLALMATFCAGALWVAVGMPGVPADRNPFLRQQNVPVALAIAAPPLPPRAAPPAAPPLPPSAAPPAAPPLPPSAAPPLPPPAALPTPPSQIEHRGVAAMVRPPAPDPSPPAGSAAERKPMPNVIGPEGGPEGGATQGGDQAGSAVESHLPAVIHPANPTEPVAEGGTGFFVAHDGSFMTAAHVVRSCTRISIVSRHLRPAVARLLAIDMPNDIALLRAAGVRPPAVLALADRAFGAESLNVLGYPGDGDMLRATETQGQMRAEHPRFKGLERLDGPDVMWMDANTVRPGFSGGPVLNASGDVVGLINGQVLHRVARPGLAAHVVKYVYGTSTRLLNAFISQEVPALVPDADQPPAVADMDKAVVHILCIH